MGLCGAPSTFQYLMDSCFHAPTTLGDSGTSVPFSQFTAVYLDHICIFSATETEHLEHIRAQAQTQAVLQIKQVSVDAPTDRVPGTHL